MSRAGCCWSGGTESWPMRLGGNFPGAWLTRGRARPRRQVATRKTLPGTGRVLRGVDLEDVGDTDLGDVLVVENPAGRGLAGLGGARGVASGAQGVAVTSVIAARAAAWSAMA